ncbi:MAG: class I SAM-dependent methyltransferase [Holosporaceae bacterium]|jgi:2-polyprenyl-3-methyl-5-hydroxy-6-metoxy-1,4-benzoquinol methylase|nr:class I SAM-dependent methyltransferase [Holosporaceae bacterium]
MRCKCIKNSLGFYQVTPHPSVNDLKEYYANKYFQMERKGGTYAHSYSEQEMEYITNRSIIAEYVWNSTYGRKQNMTRTLFDIGCGEGFFAKYFLSKGWDVTMCDFSSFGVETHNKEIAMLLTKGGGVGDLL